ncbi:MAG TPA: hypothetical protein VNJ29_03610 [Candidatus Nitrosotenuis sp.]|nr:hypothetical protein [Candidatus Nitrosotenuis sp.]
MKKFISAILLTTCLGFSAIHAMDGEVPETQITPISQSIIAEHKTLFRDFDLLNYDIIAKYRKAFTTIEAEAEQFEYPTAIEPMDLLIPLVKQGLAYVQSLKEEFPQVAIFEKEINYRLETQDVTPLWYHLLGVRIQAAISNVSADEKDIFNHVIEPGAAILEGLRFKDSWKSHEKSAYLIEGFRKKQIENISFSYIGDLDWEGVDDVIERLEKVLPAPIYWNAFGKGKLGVPFLVHSIIHDIFPMGLPRKTGTAHGTTFSPLSFTAHDFLHAEADTRRKALKAFVTQELAEQVKKGDVLFKSAPIIIEQAVKRYQLVNESLAHLFNFHVTQLNLDKDESAFKRAMAGFFWILHEQGTFNTYIYKTGDFKDIVRLLADQPLTSAEKKEEPESSSTPTTSSSAVKQQNYQLWESPLDFYPTSVLTGETQLTDKEIADNAIEVMSKEGFTSQNFNSEIFNYYVKEDPHYTVTTSKRFIDVDIIGTNGQKFRFSVPTLYHKWLNMDDNLALLKYAGTVIEKPSIDGKKERDARQIAISTLTKVEKALNTLTVDFLESSLKLVDIKWLNEYSESLTDHYRTRYSALDGEYQEQLKAVIESYKKD